MWFLGNKTRDSFTVKKKKRKTGEGTNKELIAAINISKNKT